MWEDKETTAPIPSVAPDGEQPSAFARTVSITEIEETRKQFGKIQIMTMPELMETRFRVRPAVIDGLLPAGTYLLAGAPKIGKSFLVLQMAYQVSMGAPFLGFSSRQGTVLYLALEDTYERLQKRLAQMTEQDSERLILSVFSETLDEGLIERLTDFWSEHTDTVLIIIDTLQRVRGRTPDNGSYATDYDTLAGLKEFSDTYGITVLVVHHTRKEGAEDVFIVMLVTSTAMFLFAVPIIDLFTDDTETILLAAQMLRIEAFAEPLLAIGVVLGGVLRGAGDTRWPFVISLLGMWVVRLPLAYTLIHLFDWGLAAVWGAAIADWAVRAAISCHRFYHKKWMTQKV